MMKTHVGARPTRLVLQFFKYVTLLPKHVLFVSFAIPALMQGTHGTGKTGKMAKKIPCQGKHREFCWLRL